MGIDRVAVAHPEREQRGMKCHSSSWSLVKGRARPILRVSTSKQVTVAITTSSQPEARATTSSSHRKPSASFKRALIASRAACLLVGRRHPRSAAVPRSEAREPA